jgi:hypothetical protein
MAAAASDSGFVSSFHSTKMDLTGIAGGSINGIMRCFMFVLYALLFIFTLVMVGFIEIRQANMGAFNTLIATLEQRDALRATDFHTWLGTIAEDQKRYQVLLASFVCPSDGQLKQDGLEDTQPSAQGDVSNPDLVKVCNKIKGDIQNHSYALETAQDEILTKEATLEQFYWHYKDGITQQVPQLIPALQFLDSGRKWVDAFARSPFEIMEMLLLVCMGMLGGVISVTRSYIEKSLANPSIRDLILRPAIGGAVALGIYVLFRATQLFIAGQSAGTASTSIFLVAGLGLASGVCANDAIGQIEALAQRMLRRSPDDQEGNKPAADPPLLAAPTGGDVIPASLTPSAG